MIPFLRNKLWGSKWLTLCLIIGNILLVGIAAGTPIYITATMQRIMMQDYLASVNERNTFPAASQLMFAFNAAGDGNQLALYEETLRETLPWVRGQFGLPVTETIGVHVAAGWRVEPVESRQFGLVQPVGLSLFGAEGFEDNVRLTHGRLPSSELVDGNVIEAIAHAATISATVGGGTAFVYNELMRFPDIEGLYFRIVGVFEIPHESEAYWSLLPFDFRTVTFLVSDTLLRERFARNYEWRYNMLAFWIDILDHSAIHVLDVPGLEASAALIAERFAGEESQAWAFSEDFVRWLVHFGSREIDIGLTMWVLQLNVLIMLGLYIFMVSRQILQIDTSAISVLRSRGASRFQIMAIYAMQGVFVAAVSFAPGIAAGVGLSHVLGASNGFMELVQRDALTVVVTGEALMYGAAALGLSFLTMFVPVIGFSRVDIVESKQSKRDFLAKPLWQRYMLDFAFLGLALYGLFSFGSQQALVEAALLSETPGVDPMVYFVSSLFVLGAGLVCLRFFPYLMKLVFLLGRRLWSPSMYVSLLKIVRSTGEEKFIMLFLIFCVSIGIYGSQMARTINLNNEHRIRYTHGADVAFREFWPVLEEPPEMEYVWFEPDFSRFQHFEETEAMTRVVNRDGFMLNRGRQFEFDSLQSIETNSFGETVWFRDDLFRVHMNHYLNALAMLPNGVLLSDNFRTEYGFQVGDSIRLVEYGFLRRNENPGFFVIVGFVEYWPGFAPVGRQRTPAGEIQEVRRNLAVVNLGHTVSLWGMRPYEVWMRTGTDSNAFLSRFLAEEEIRVMDFRDADAAFVAAMNDPVIVATNGVLTIGFVVILVVCFIGFLIYWMLSIRSRVLQFGIFRAMGMSLRGIISMLVNEQLFVTLVAIGIGVFVGGLCAQLFVPMVQVGYTAAEQAIPILIVSLAQDYLNILSVLGASILLCLIVLVFYIAKIRIDQALKLGEE